LSVCASPTLAAEPGLTSSEHREVLAALEELLVLRHEVSQLREILQKDEETIEGLKTQHAAMEQLVRAQSRMLETADKIIALQVKAIETYQRIAQLAEDRAARAEDRAERAQKLIWLGPIGLVVGAILGIFLGL